MAKNPSVSALLKPQASVGRNAFPLDQKHVFSIKAGEITPVKALHFMPNDFFNIQAHDFSMTFPMNTAAFLRGRKETAFYSVYYNAVWSLYNQYMATRRDPKTSGLDTKQTLHEPRVSLFSLYMNCLVQYYFYIIYEHVSRWVALKNVGSYPYETGYRIAQQELVNQRLNNNSCFEGITIRWGDNQSDTADLQELVYYQTQEDIIRGQYGWNWSLLTAPDGNCAFKDFALDMASLPRVFSWIRKLDMLGYGNVYPYFEIAERNIQKVFAKEASECDTLHELLHVFRPYFSDLFYKLLDCSTLNDHTEPAVRIVINQHKYVNLYSLCAYNLVFYHFFRNSYYDLKYEPNDYNLDFAYQRNNTTINGILSLSSFSVRFLDIEHHQWKKDLFTAVLPDTQFGAVSSLSINIDPENSLSGGVVRGNTATDIDRWTIRDGSQPIPSGHTVSTSDGNDNSLAILGMYGISHTHQMDGFVDYSNASGHVDNALDVIAIKRAELLQDYRQTLMRAGNKTSDIFKAIYGGAPSSEHEDDIIPRFLETFGEDLFVDPVEATATTGQDNNGTLGDLSARGKFRGDSKPFKFNAGNNFGVILCLTYVVPEAEYNSYMLDKHNLELSPEAHYLPTYENWGLEPIYSDELNSLLPMKDIQSLGYAPRYYHKKQAIDQVHGAFVSLNSQLNDSGVAALNIEDYDFFGEFNHWVCPRTDMQNRQITLLRDFYISPRVLDNVFVRAAGADLADDQFICNMYFEIKSTRGLSKVGLLNFV